MSEQLPALPPAKRLEIARRVRAAMAYSLLDASEIVRRMGGVPGLATLRRITSSTSPRGASLAELWRLADACEVPRAWLEHGEWPASGPVGTTFGHGSTSERLEVVERYLEMMVRSSTHGVLMPSHIAPAESPPARRRRPPVQSNH